MKNGCYSMQFSAGGFVESGTLSVANLEAEGHGQRFGIRGRLANTGQRLTASMTVETFPGSLRNRFIGHTFTLSMQGVDAEGQFSLCGVGPLGVIVELVAIESASPRNEPRS
jgi:hypothetical protein